MGIRRSRSSEDQPKEEKESNLLRPQDSSLPVSADINDSICDRLKDGDSTVLAELINAYGHSLLRFAASIVESRDMAEDVVQYVFINLWARRSELDAKSNLRAYLFKAVRNRALNERSKESVRRRYVETSMLNSNSQSGQSVHNPGHEEAIFHRLTVQAAVERLSERRQMAVKLRLENELSHAEIAEIMGISTGAAKRLVARSLEELREILWEEEE